MKLLTISVLWALAIPPLAAEGQASSDSNTAWRTMAIQAQAELRQSHFAAAAESGQQALQIAKHFGSSDARLASTYHLLGLTYRDWGRCAESRSNYLHAVAIWRKQPVPNPRYIFTAISNLLGVLYECDDFDTADKVFRTYEPDLLRYRTDSLDDARLLSLRAVLARGKKNYPRAESLLRQSIELMEKAPRAKPIDIALERSNLAVVLDKQGRYAEAFAESERDIAFFEQAAPKHPSLVAALNNAACALSDLGRKEESERMFQRALAAGAELYGEDNHVTAKIMLSYAAVLRRNKQLPEAEVLQKKGTEAFRRAFTRDNGLVDVEELRK